MEFKSLSTSSSYIIAGGQCFSKGHQSITGISPSCCTLPTNLIAAILIKDRNWIWKV